MGDRDARIQGPRSDSYGLSGVGPPGTGDARPIAGSPYPRNRRRKRSEERSDVCSSDLIAMLESKGRVRIHMDCLEWVRRALETPGLSLVPLTPEIAVESTRLPGNIHADPADRILVATARNLGARLMTRDQALLDYGRKRHARIVSA